MQAFDRYAYVNNSPINFSDPSGHSTECGIGDPYCQAGELNVVKRAQDLAVDNKREERLRGSRVYWAGLSHEERSILSEGGFDEGAYNDYLDDDTREASLLEDPAFYVSVALSGGTKLITSLLGAACSDGNCTNEAEAISGGGQKGITVLGRYPEYVNASKDIGGRIFNVPPETWNKLTRPEQWALNQQYLDEAIARGDTFYLASRWAKIVPGSFYHMELEYLFSQGFTLSLYQNYLIAPAK